MTLQLTTSVEVKKNDSSARAPCALEDLLGHSRNRVLQLESLAFDTLELVDLIMPVRRRHVLIDSFRL